MLKKQLILISIHQFINFIFVGIYNFLSKTNKYTENEQKSNLSDYICVKL